MKKLIAAIIKRMGKPGEYMKVVQVMAIIYASLASR